ncbi:MAG: signal transduction histidine kinase [Nonlabens sp.]|jgi:signal transduction histidine kinase
MSKILIIEDEAILRETLTDILEISGYIVVQAKDGEEGIEIFTKTAPDLVICDVNMPKMDGYEVLEMLEALIPTSEFPPFIFLSAKAEPHSIRKGMNLGAVDYITKPYSAPELLKVIELRLQKRKKLQVALIQDERARMSQELHDGVQNLIVAAGMGISAVVGRFDEMPKKYQDLLKNSGQLLDQAISETRSVSSNLIPHLDGKRGLENYLNLIVETVRSSTDIKLDLNINLEGKLIQNQIHIYICRLVQEMITNTIKHAKAKTVTIKISRTENNIHVNFQDDGIGFDINEHTDGIGLQHLVKKAKEFNGELIIKSEVDHGTKIHLTLQTDNFT